jgi:hypothetical protein
MSGHLSCRPDIRAARGWRTTPYGSGLDLDRSPYRSADASQQRPVSRWPWQDGPVVADAALPIEQLAPEPLRARACFSDRVMVW